MNIINRIGGACCASITPEIISKLEKGGYLSLDDLDNIDINDSSRYIIINPKFLRDKSISTPKNLKNIILHEYGHVLSMDKLSDYEKWESEFKTSILRGLYMELSNRCRYLLDNYTQANLDSIYHKLPVEKAANSIANIDPDDIIEANIGIKPNGIIKWINGDKFLEYKIPEEFLELINSSNINSYADMNLHQLNIIYNVYYKLYTQTLNNKKLINYNIEALNNQLNGLIDIKARNSFNENSLSFMDKSIDTGDPHRSTSYYEELAKIQRRDIEIYEPYEHKGLPGINFKL